MTLETSQESLKNSLRILSNILVLGFIMAMGMLYMSFTTDEAILSIDSAQNPTDVENTIMEHGSKARIFIMMDTLFIVGYTALFIGLYLMLRQDQETIARIAFIFGMIVSIGDVMENSILFALFKGIPNGWVPDPSLYVFLWFIGYLVDTSSYVSGILFGTGLFSSNTSTSQQKILGILFILYSFVGILAYQSSIFLLIRSFFFVVGLSYAAIVFRSMS